MKFNILFFVLLFTLSTTAQNNLISYFDWDSNPLTNSTYGPNASSVSSSAFSDSLGSSNTNGLNAGNNPKKNINLIIPGSYFDVDGIHVSIDFQREENTGYFFTRGNSLKFGMTSGKLRIQYRLSDGNGGYVQHVHTNLYTIPNDDVFRNYAFSYNHTTGKATIEVDSLEIWSSNEDIQPLYWVGAGNMVIGSGMDGTGYNNTFFDNARISEIMGDVLPIDYLTFSVLESSNLPLLKWKTVNEKNNSKFIVEKSYDGLEFFAIGKVNGKNNSSDINEYSFLDEEYKKGGTVYFRLNQIDNEGKNTHSKILTFLSEIKSTELVKVYPSLLDQPNQELTLEFQSDKDAPINLNIFSINGKLLNTRSLHVTKGNNLLFINSKIENHGSYILMAESNGKIYSSKLVY